MSFMNSDTGNSGTPDSGGRLSRYECQKRRDWNTFCQYLQHHRPPLTLSRCSGAHVLEFLRYLDQFGKTKVHLSGCPYFGHPHPPSPCLCPLKQAWGSLDAIVGRLRAALKEYGGQPENNPFGVRAVRLYLREVRDSQAKARGVSYEKKKKKKRNRSSPTPRQQSHGQCSSAPATAAETVIPHGQLQVADLDALNKEYQHQVHEHFMMRVGENGGADDRVAMPVVAEAHSGGMIPLQVLH